ncbi:MAG: YkgJ family cysteine cluster protein [Hydrogenoanaerobacterium sp.]
MTDVRTGMSRSVVFPISKKTQRLKLLQQKGFFNDEGDCGDMNAQVHKQNYDSRLLENVMLAYENIDREIELQQKENRIKFFCYKGCSACCDEYFYVSKGEYLAINQYLSEHGITAETIEKAAEQKHRLKEVYSEEYNKLNSTTFKANGFDDNQISKGFAQCIFLKDGACSIYPVRPIICRLYGISHSYAVCEGIMEKCKVFWHNREKMQEKLKAHTVDIPYDERWSAGIDYIIDNGNTVFLKPFPLFWWFSGK